MTLSQIHVATVESDRTSQSFADSALDCLLIANESEDVHDSAVTQAMVYAQLATAAATLEIGNGRL